MELWTLYLSSLWKEYACQIGSSTQASLVNIKLKPHHLRWMFAWKNPPLHPSFPWKNAGFFFGVFVWNMGYNHYKWRNQWIPEAGNISYGKSCTPKVPNSRVGNVGNPREAKPGFLFKPSGGGVSFSPWLLVLGIATSRYIINVKM